MKCDKSKLSMMLDIYGELGKFQSLVFKRHISKCFKCKTEYENIKKLKNDICFDRIAPDKKSISNIMKRASAEFSSEKSELSKIPFLSPLKVTAALAAVAAFIAVSLWIDNDKKTGNYSNIKEVDKPFINKMNIDREIMKLKGGVDSIARRIKPKKIASIDSQIARMRSKMDYMKFRDIIAKMSKHDREILILNMRINKLVSDCDEM